MSQSSIDALALLMFKVDTKLIHGFSRKLIIDALNTDKMTQKYGRIHDDPNAKEGEEPKHVEILQKAHWVEFLQNSGYKTKAKQQSCSMNLREFLRFLDATIGDHTLLRGRPADDTPAFDEFVLDFIAEVWDQINNHDFEAKLKETIQLAENPELAQKIKEEKEKAQAQQAPSEK